MTPGSARLALFLPWNAAEAERIVQSGFCKQTVYSRIWHVNNAARRQNTMQLTRPAAAACYQMSKHPRRQHSFSCCSSAAAHTSKRNGLSINVKKHCTPVLYQRTTWLCCNFRCSLLPSPAQMAVLNLL